METYTVSNDEETFYIPEEDYHVPQNSEEAFQFLLKEEIDFLEFVDIRILLKFSIIFTIKTSM